ncbi:hypothetical protein KRX57_07310 [Weeksellaceae bacterium TAE3-ERU29]|nr:hypothetical protein [Weeksellaceae bacterium TAE3-ERU29]
MIFHKKRDFGELISDTFEFFKTYGKNYLKTYLTINGGVLILLLILVGVGFKDIIGQAFSSNLAGESYYFEEYFDQNSGTLIIVSILVVGLIFLLSMISYAFPVLYLDAASKTKRNDFTVNEMFEKLKAKAGKIIIFSILSFIVFVPLLFITFGLSAVLIFLIIGLFLIIALIPIFTAVVNFTLFDYLTTDNGYFTALGRAFGFVFSKNFWKYLGGVIVMYFLVQIIVSVFSVIPAFISGVSAATIDTTGEEMSTLSIILIVVFYFLSLVASFIASNAIYVMTGLMYYDSREDLQREVHFDEIDSIGKNV